MKSEKLPITNQKAIAGFPSPAEDYIVSSLNLNDYVIKNPAVTFFVRAKGNLLCDMGINDNDILIVDRSISPTHGKLVIAIIDGEFIVKRVCKKNNGQWLLVTDNSKQNSIKLNESIESYIWGTITYVIHAV